MSSRLISLRPGILRYVVAPVDVAEYSWSSTRIVIDCSVRLVT